MAGSKFPPFIHLPAIWAAASRHNGADSRHNGAVSRQMSSYHVLITNKLTLEFFEKTLELLEIFYPQKVPKWNFPPARAVSGGVDGEASKLDGGGFLPAKSRSRFLF